MAGGRLDRDRLALRPLRERASRLRLSEVAVDPDAPPARWIEAGLADPVVPWAAARIRQARSRGAAVVLVLGAHAIRNGLGPVMLRLAARGFVTHFATNGAGSIHDWEFAHAGVTCEDVASGQASGTFGLWDETGRWTALAVAAGCVHGLGFGSAMGTFIENEGVEVPPRDEILRVLQGPDPDAAGTAADLLWVLDRLTVGPGRAALPHPFKEASLQAGLHRLGVPLTVHVSVGQDIVHQHPAASGAVFGRASYRDFLALGRALEGLTGGVLINLGSAVTGPMVVEKAFAMAQNLALRRADPLRDFAVVVVDLAAWDWTRGEPPSDHPAYYQRAFKTFTRLGGDFRACALDNRAFLCGLWKALEGRS